MALKQSVPVTAIERLLMSLRIKQYRWRTYRDLLFYTLFFFTFLVLVFFIRDLRVEIFFAMLFIIGLSSLLNDNAGVIHKFFFFVLSLFV